MHRVGRPTTCTAPQAVRLYSTPPPAKARAPIQRWGNLVIPSRQEVIALRTKRSNTDINYLKFENEKSLAARLARPTIDITLARQSQETKAQSPEETNVEADSEASPIQDEVSEDLPTSTPISVTIETMIKQRREARLQREREHHLHKERIEAERAQYEELRLARVAHRKEVEEEKRAKIHAAINDFHQPLNRIAPTTTTATATTTTTTTTITPEVDQRRAHFAKLAAELAAKRRLEREQRENELVESGPVRRDRQLAQTPSHRSTVSDAKRREEEDFQTELSEEGAIGSFEPQFQDPEPPISGLALMDILRPSDKASSIRGGNYSNYITPSPSDFSTSPDELGAVKLAGVALSHRRDVSLPQRHQSLALISKALARKPISRPRAEPQ